MKITEHVEKGRKAKFETLEDVLQSFFCIAGAVYQAAAEEVTDNSGVVEMQATDARGRIRIRIDYLKEGEKS